MSRLHKCVQGSHEKMNETKKITKTEKIENVLFSLQLVCVALNVFSAMWQISELTSLIIAASFGITAALAFITISNKNNKYTVLLWLITVILSYISVTKGKTNVNFEYLKVWIMFITTINLYFWVYAAKVNDVMIKRIFICGLVTAGLFILGFLLGRTKTNPQMPELVTFGLSNPNLAGIYLLNVFLCVYILTKFFKKKILRISCYAICVALFYFICLTEARSCIIAAVACIFLSFLSNKKYSRFLTFVILIFPLIFAILYLKLINTDVASFFEFMETEGKSLTSRVLIWERNFYVFRNNVLLGSYYHSGGNTHNTHIMILAAFGIFTFTLVITYLNRIVNYIGTFIREKYQIIALYAFYAVILMGTFEAVLFSGSQGMYVFSGAFLLIAKYVNQENPVDQEVQK